MASLDSLPRHVLVDCVLLPYCSGRDACSLLFTSKTWWDALGQEDALWKHLYSDERSSLLVQQAAVAASSRIPQPRFPSCGNWRDVYLRSLRYRRLVIIRTLTRPDEDLRLVLPRITPLFGLKREIRSAQLRLDGLLLEDFDLVDPVQGLPVGIAGNDSLPPVEDIRKLLFLGNTRPDAAAAALFGPEQRRRRRSDAAWRANLSLLPDGIVLHQVLLNSNSNTDTCLVRAVQDDKPWDVLRALTHELQRGGGPTAYKTTWRHSATHPLLQRAHPLNLALFGVMYAKSTLRLRFALDVVVLKGLLTSGFALSFYRVCSMLFPLVWTSQIKQMFRITHVLFLPVFVRDLVRVTWWALWPVIKTSLRVELLRLLVRLVFTWETPYETLGVSLAEVVREAVVGAAGAGGGGWDLDSLARYLSTSPAVAYSFSTLFYSGFTLATEPSLWVSLPLYMYSLPIVYCVIVLRIRIFLAQSYVSLLLA